jgi:hypothetical protein
MECDAHFPEGSCLRRLATEIAILDLSKQPWVASVSPLPYNLLANGDTGANWTSPQTNSAAGLMAWKNAATGTGSPSRPGLALMFDPFVDACLLIESQRKDGLAFKNTKVLVLTRLFTAK